jgi:hypothetical protein
MLRSFILFIAALFLLSSCEKAEKALVLPKPGTASHDAVNMGNDYDKQIFYDFDTKSAVLINGPNKWDLAFESSPSGKHVYMNGGDVGIQMYNTHKTSMQQVTSLPPECATPTSLGWRIYDDPSGLPNLTAIGNWDTSSGATKGEVYIIQNANKVSWKLRILTVSSTTYKIEWAPLASVDAPIAVQLDKDTVCNFVYFSFANGVVKVEPPKDTWDVVFTRYRYIYRNYGTYNGQPYDFGYTFSGVLLNPCATTAGADSSTSFGAITLQIASAMQLSNHRDVIVADWKQYDFNTGRYTVNRAKNYVLSTRKGQLYKLHFLEYYNSAGEKGNPAFEFERLK